MFLMPFHQKSQGLVSHKLLNQFLGLRCCRSLRLLFSWSASGKEDNRSEQDPENMIDAEELPNTLLEGCFCDVYNKDSGVVVKQDDLALSIRSFLLHNLIQKVQMGYVEGLNLFVLFEHFTMYKTLQVPLNAEYVLLKFG